MDGPQQLSNLLELGDRGKVLGGLLHKGAPQIEGVRQRHSHSHRVLVPQKSLCEDPNLDTNKSLVCDGMA